MTEPREESSFWKYTPSTIRRTRWFMISGFLTQAESTSGDGFNIRKSDSSAKLGGGWTAVEMG